MRIAGYTSPQSHEERLAQLDDLLSKQWRPYIHTPPVIEEGSSLAADNRLFPVYPPSDIAWAGIGSAVDHLDMFMALLRDGISYPLAPSTLARTGMLAGAHALWVLDGPDRATRQRRGLQLAYEEFYREHQAVKDIATIETDDPKKRLAEMADYLDARTEWMQRAIDVGAQLDMAPKDVRNLNDTAMLDETTRRLAARDAADKELIRAVRLVWRTYSGIAHGLRWPALYRTKFGGPVPGGRPGKVEGRVTNSVADLSMGASSVAIFLLNAIELFEKRRVAASQ